MLEIFLAGRVSRHHQHDGVAAADADHAHRARLRIQHGVAQGRRHLRLAERRDRHETEVAAALRGLRVLGEVRGQLRERRAGLQPLHQHLRLGLCFLRRAGVVAGAIDLLVRAHRRHDDLRDVHRIFGAVERRLVGFIERLDVIVGDDDLRGDFAFDDLVGEQVAPQALAHVGGRQIAARQLLLELIVGDVLLRLGVGVVELGVRPLRSSARAPWRAASPGRSARSAAAAWRPALLPRTRCGCAAAAAAKRLLDLVAGDLAAVDDGPRVRR